MEESKVRQLWNTLLFVNNFVKGLVQDCKAYQEKVQKLPDVKDNAENTAKKPQSTGNKNSQSVITAKKTGQGSPKKAPVSKRKKGGSGHNRAKKPKKTGATVPEIK